MLTTYSDLPLEGEEAYTLPVCYKPPLIKEVYPKFLRSVLKPSFMMMSLSQLSINIKPQNFKINNTSLCSHKLTSLATTGYFEDEDTGVQAA